MKYTPEIGGLAAWPRAQGPLGCSQTEDAVGLSRRTQGDRFDPTSGIKLENKSPESLQVGPQIDATSGALSTICRPLTGHHRLVEFLFEAMRRVGI